MVLVSACLAGLNTRYDGTACCDRYIESLVSMGKAVPVCPEQLGGLPTPREPVELDGGDGKGLASGKTRAIGIETGKDYTHNFLRGADEVFRIAVTLQIKKAFLKDGSPSCGCSYIKAGTQKVKGVGATAAALLKAGIEVIIC